MNMNETDSDETGPDETDPDKPDPDETDPTAAASPTARPARPLYLAIEGPIGVGKTTLVHRLAERLGARVVLEVVEENPFLARFYEDRVRYAFSTQLFFLMSRFRQQQELLQGDLFLPSLVSDYHLLKDRIFAHLTLDSDELALYERVFQSLESHILQPDAIIYLHADQDTLIERIARRNRAFEQDFDRNYLAELSEMYRHFFAHYRKSPVLSIDTTRINYAEDDAAVESVLHAIGRLNS